MLENFIKNYTETLSMENVFAEMQGVPFEYSELLINMGGKQFDDGLYTIYTFRDAIKWTNILNQYYEQFKNKIIAFACDWMGRQFCINIMSIENILIFDPGTLEDFYIEADLFNFHNTILADNKQVFFALDLYKKALNQLRINSINFGKCIGLITPLFLGGKEEITNLNLYDLEVYWSMEYQLYRKVSSLPNGTQIGKIGIDPFYDL